MKRCLIFFMMGVLGMTTLAGCSVMIRYPEETPSKTVITQQQLFLFWGLSGGTSIEVYEKCPYGRVSDISVFSSASQVILSVVTLGIYTPRTIEIHCSAKTEPFPPIPERVLNFERSAPAGQKDSQSSSQETNGSANKQPPSRTMDQNLNNATRKNPQSDIKPLPRPNAFETH
ncbi:MAG: hypothetical protein HQM12_03640 [SAR324 cluster bacterium]|nr:hypothetical protein [SAR324 cluster bacterium]